MDWSYIFLALTHRIISNSLNWFLIGSGINLLPVQRQAVTWIKAEIYCQFDSIMKQISDNYSKKQESKYFFQDNESRNVLSEMIAILAWLNVKLTPCRCYA